VTLQAQRVYVVPSQETRIRRTVRIVTCTATLRLDWRVLINKRTSLFCMALDTDGIAGDAAAQSLVLEGAMRIVTIAAIYQPFIHFVMEGLRKSGLHVSVAGIAQLRLRNLEKVSLGAEFMNAMATRATYACLSVCGTLEIRMCRGVALQAFAIDCLRCRYGEPEEGFQIAATSLYMLSTWPVAALACNALAAMQHRKAGVRILSELLVDLTVTELTGL
jgi:hypothetical protein